MSWKQDSLLSFELCDCSLCTLANILFEHFLGTFYLIPCDHKQPIGWLILDDLMAEATDSPVVSRLFTQGRHRNASVILLLQNMFPKGKYNTNISRNAQYLALFRSPSDRKQIGIIAERMFDKNRVHFMNAYYKETEKPYGHLLVDNKPGTPPDNQILADLFAECYAYHFGVNSTEPVGKHSTATSSRKKPVQTFTRSVVPNDVWQKYMENTIMPKINCFCSLLYVYSTILGITLSP